MEKADNVYIMPSQFGWSDLGTWASAYDNLEKDYLGNAVAGDNVIVFDAHRNMVHNQTDKLVVGGNVKLVQGSTVLVGNELRTDLKTKRTQMSGGRVKGSFLPK